MANNYKDEVAYILKNHKDKAENTIKYADMFVDHVFLFNTENDLEQMDDAVTYGKKIDWEYKPGSDQEYVWQFNRQRYWMTMGQAYQLTGDEKYASEYAYQLEDWINENPLTEEKKATTWRILEAGFRGEYWTKAYNYFKESKFVTKELTEKLFDCLRVHADYIVSMHSPYRLISNWGVIENHGLFMISLTLPEDEKTLFYRNTAIDHLEKLCRMAVMPDGAQWEQSPMYHNEVLKDLLDVVLISKERGITLPQAILDTVYKMALCDLTWQKPNHREFMNGDSDDFDISQFLCKAAIAYENPYFKFGAYDEVDYEIVWEVGLKGIEAYEALTAKMPEFTSKALEDSGNYYFRTNWSDKANLMHFHCGTIGAGHGHSDKLHIDLVARGEDVLMDGGRYSYVYGPKRHEYKDPTMHNTIIVDNKFFTELKDSWECTKLSAPVKQQFVIKDNYEFVQGGHLGYMDLGVYVNRKIVHIKPDIYIVVDECYGKGKHLYKSFWHFSDEGSVTLEKNEAIYHGNNADTHLYFISDDVKVAVTDTHISRSYNHELTNKTIELSYEGEGNRTNVTVIKVMDKGSAEIFEAKSKIAGSALKKIDYPKAKAEAISVKTKDKDYLVMVAHQEVNSPTDLLEADGCLGFGQVIVFDKAVEKEIGTVLLY